MAQACVARSASSPHGVCWVGKQPSSGMQVALPSAAMAHSVVVPITTPTAGAVNGASSGPMMSAPAT